MPPTRRTWLALAATLACTGVLAQAAWPDKPIRLVVPYAAGGATDGFARIVAEGVGKRLGQNVVVDNRPGANGGLGLTAVQRAPADGYTVLFTLTSIVQNPLLYANVGYDPFKDFAPVSEAGRLPIVFTVSTKLGVDSLAGFVEKARAAPGKLSYGSFGAGSSAHMYMELLQDAAGIQLLHVPYKGEAPAITDLLGGNVDAVFVSARGVSPHVAAGKAKSIAVVGTARAPLAAEVPTFREQGYQAMDLVGWFGMFAPAGTPAPVVQRISEAVAEVVRDPALKPRIEALGVIPVGSTPAQLAQTMRADQAVWGKVIRDKNIRLE
ncbi:tripartite tricarboxylate transporter substrate binding protein [Pseudorhodoferax sp. LjRoot39]|uniref:Bug family tripartite tricarboxylate transporter substrate binding protein n=1 Tax=Pseudorhodoferax sp. LjRoot39 TaxID=3342328 RepID=UPI003ECEA61D